MRERLREEGIDGWMDGRMEQREREREKQEREGDGWIG